MMLPQHRKWRFALGIFIIALVIAALPHGCDLLWGNAPISLHGKVIDQMGNAVPSATVSFEAMARSRFQLPILFSEGGETTWRLQGTSGTDGTFAIDDGWGRVMFLKSVGRPGYTQGCLYLTFYYGRNPPEPVYPTDRGHPAVFMCWNNAFKRIVSRDVVAPIGSEWCTLAYRTGRTSQFGTGDENLEFRIIRPASNGASDWALEVDGFHGEVAPATGSIGSRAPERGYARALRFTDWKVDASGSRTLHAQFYSRGPDLGPNTVGNVFAGVEVTARIAEGKEATATIHYTADFGNSRDLLAGPVIPAGK